MHRQSEPRAGNHQRHTRTRNVSLPTQANHTARGARKQPPNRGAIHAASEDTTHTSNHTATRAASADQHGTHRGRNRPHRVVCWFDAFTAAWSGIAVGGWTNVARPLVLIVARVRYRGRLWVPVTKRRSSRACIGNPNPEQETIKGTHAQETAAHQRRPATQHAAQGSNPPIGALYLSLIHI